MHYYYHYHYHVIQVEFLPPNTTSLIQPMDQGVIRAFKALYTRSTMEGLISFIDENNVGFSLKNCWREYNIATCLVNIQKALNEMREQTLIASWRKLWPKNVTHDYEGFMPDQVHHSAVDNTVRVARLVATEGFSNMTTEDVPTLIDCHLKPLTDEELIEMTRSMSKKEEEVAGDSDDNEAEERGLTLANLQELCNIAQTLQQRAQEIDDMVIAVEFSNRIDGVMELYKKIFALKKKTTLNSPSQCSLYPENIVPLRHHLELQPKLLATIHLTMRRHLRSSKALTNSKSCHNKSSKKIFTTCSLVLKKVVIRVLKIYLQCCTVIIEVAIINKSSLKVFTACSLVLKKLL
ncbi:tigger transposable element-derived protein 1 isoform X9 [Syngnathus scovelli]|uniref:tigger transposable element-derived protein 1 isoform X9 n=1 Tax=Syngnathus scovelli TaxID=161590 RepID=UPI0035C98961